MCITLKAGEPGPRGVAWEQRSIVSPLQDEFVCLFVFSFKMILLKVFIEPHPDSRSSCQADPVKTSCSSSAAAVESMQGTEWWEGTIFSPPNDLWKRTVSLILGNLPGSWKIQVEVYREASPQGKTGFAAEINISRPKELIRNITTVTLFIRYTKRSHLEWNS